MFEELQIALKDYEELMKSKPQNHEEEYKVHCAELNIAKAFVYDLGYTYASKFARAILALGELKD